MSFLVRSAGKVESIEELDLSKDVEEYFLSQGISVNDLILTARRDPLGYAGYPSRMMREVIDCLDARGYIMHGFNRNIGYMNLLAAILGQDGLKIVTRLEDFESNIEYEEYRALDSNQIKALDEVLDMILRPEEQFVIYSHYGIRGYKKCTPREAAMSRDWTERRFYNTENRAMTKLQQKHRRLIFIGILRYYKIGVRLRNIDSE